jgi:hypothetical protein
MPHAMRAPSPVMGLSEIVDAFKRLDGQRRSRGLSLSEAEEYNVLFARLSEVLASGERHRRADARQFLRIRFRMELVVRTQHGEVLAACEDFGGGGCAIVSPTLFQLGDDVWLDGARIEGRPHPLHGRAVVVWTRLQTVASPQPGYGLRFAIDSSAMRDQIDRVLYRVLDLVLAV